MIPGKPHILVIDDNEDILEMVCLMLTRNGCHVSVKKRLDNPEIEISQLAPDLVMLDKSLGWADGCDVCGCIKRHAALYTIPVIMFSAYYKAGDCLHAGADAFLEKPFTLKNLMSTITGLITITRNVKYQ